MNKTFSSFKEASEYAKKMARSGCSSVKCSPRNNGYYEVTAILPVANATVQPDEIAHLKSMFQSPHTQSYETKSSLKSPLVKKKSMETKVKPDYCTQCGKKIPKERLAIALNSKYCVPCLSKLESENPDDFRRSMDVDGIGGTR
ncbi:TPA: hypothetical protein ACX6SJ_003718, partial [Photobacterium damselae]